MPKGKVEVTFRHKGESVTLQVGSGRPRIGETADEAFDRRVKAAKKDYRASVA